MKNLALIIALFVSVHTAEAGFLKKIFPTKLKITVIDNLGNVVEGATVKLFRTEEDYRTESNQAYETVITDEKGRAKFKKIDAVSYFLLVEHEKRSNIGGGVKVEPLQEGKNNKINTVIK